MSVILNCGIREELGSNRCSSLRRAGFVPATIYGPGMTSVNISISDRDVAHNLLRFLDNTVIELRFESGDSAKVTVKSFERHPLTEKVLHVDFFFFSDSVSKFKIPVKFLNRDVSQAIKLGGVLNIVKRKVDVKCKPGDLPRSIEVDIKECNVGDSIRMRDLKLPEGVTPVSRDPDSAIATIIGRKVKAAVGEADGAQQDAAGSA